MHNCLPSVRWQAVVFCINDKIRAENCEVCELTFYIVSSKIV